MVNGKIDLVLNWYFLEFECFGSLSKFFLLFFKYVVFLGIMSISEEIFEKVFLRSFSWYIMEIINVVEGF